MIFCLLAATFLLVPIKKVVKAKVLEITPQKVKHRVIRATPVKAQLLRNQEQIPLHSDTVTLRRRAKEQATVNGVMAEVGQGGGLLAATLRVAEDRGKVQVRVAVEGTAEPDSHPVQLVGLDSPAVPLRAPHSTHARVVPVQGLDLGLTPILVVNKARGRHQHRVVAGA